MLALPAEVVLCDVTLRDGLQAEKSFVATDDKLALYHALLAAGVRHFEIGAFVSPKVIPQMADSAAVIARAPKPPGVTFQALVPNLTGALRALEAPVDELIYLSTASETYTRRNQNRSIDEVFAMLAEVVAAAHARGVAVRLGIGMAFACPFEGTTPPEKVLQLVERGVAAGVDAVQPADSIGTATPRAVQHLVRAIRDRWPKVGIGLHFHDNRGQALANILAGLDAGCAHFDAAAGGLGGTPVYAGSMGNACLEDVAYMMEGMGIGTGIDLGRLVDAARLAEQIVGHPVPGRLLRTGARTQ